MKRSILVLFFTHVFFLGYTLYAQPQKRDFKQEVSTILEAYNNALNVFGDTSSTPKGKLAQKKRLLELITVPYILVPNDFSEQSQDSLIPFNKYINMIDTSFKNGFTSRLQLSKMEFEDLSVNKNRNAYEVKATLKKAITYPFIIEKVSNIEKVDTFMLPDSTSRIETINMEVINYDTTEKKILTELTFYFTTKVMFGEFTPLKIQAIQIKSRKPKYAEPLSELSAWWVSLSPAWKERIRAQIKLPELATDYYLKRVHGITEIDLKGISKENVELVKQFKSLKKLDLSGLELDTLFDMSGFTQLRELNVSHNLLNSIHGVENCINLEYLNFSDNNVRDIEGIVKMQKLYTLAFDNNIVEDVSAIQYLPSLRILLMSNNKIMDITALKKTHGIKRLDISKNQEIETLEPIRHLHTMEHLNCFNTKVSTLDPIKEMVNIRYLNVGFTKITSIDALKRFKHLNNLTISGCSLTDFSAFNHLDHLTKFACAQVNITDISPFLKMKKLRVFTAPYTDFSKTDIQRLKKKFPKCAITYY